MVMVNKKQSVPAFGARLRQKSFLTGTWLKWLAMVSMFIDHFGATLWYPIYAYFGLASSLGSDWGAADTTYTVLRSLGRIAFPIFCFLLVEGLHYTHSVPAYLKRLGLLAVISEIPFDLAFYDQFFYWGHQNVFFTLALGALGIWSLKLDQSQHDRPWRGFLVCLLLAFLAEISGADYGAFGVGLILLLASTYEQRELMVVAGTLVTLWEGPAVLLSYALIYAYNGQRGRFNGRWFYALYPLHLLLYYLLRQGLWH